MESLALPTTTYHCTITPICRFSTTTFETWVSHELSDHPITTRNIWLCHRTPSVLECTCNLAFNAKIDFERHWFIKHPKDEITNWRVLYYDDYFLGPTANKLFWCGFCRRVLSCHMTCNWTVDRFEHVAAHFQVWHAKWDHFDINAWKYLLFWETPIPEADDEVKKDVQGDADEGSKVKEEDKGEVGKGTKRLKGVKDPKIRRSTRVPKVTKFHKNADGG